MAAAQGDIIQITDIQTLLGQQVLNVYYYRILPIGGIASSGYAEMLEWFDTEIVERVCAIQNVALEHTSLELRNLSNGIDLETLVYDPPKPGDASGVDPLPSYVSWGFLLRRESLVTRNGYKRYAGVSEDQIDGNEYVLSLTPMTALATALAADYVEGILPIAEPIILKRPIPAPGGTFLYASIGAAEFRGPGTQNTRKPGRGD